MNLRLPLVFASFCRSLSVSEIIFGVFAAVQTFFALGLLVRFEVLFWLDWSALPYVAMLWLLVLAAASMAFFLAAALLRVSSTLEDTDLQKRVGTGKRLVFVLVFLAVIILGGFLRWTEVDLVPPGMWTDAPYESQMALRSPDSVGWLGGVPLDAGPTENSAVVSNLYLQYCKLIFSLFGRGETGVLSISAVGGWLSLLAVFWLAWECCSAQSALLATFLIAFGAWPLILSRWAWTGALMIPLILAAAAATLAALRTRRLGYALLGGALLGLALHTHPASWAVAAGFGVFCLVQARKGENRRLVAGGLVTALLVVTPFLLAYLSYPSRLGGRIRDVPVGTLVRDTSVPFRKSPLTTPIQLAYNLLEYSGMTVWTYDSNPRHGLVGLPVVTPLLGIAALVGVALSCRRACRGSGPDLLLLCLACGALFAGILSNAERSPNTFRACGVMGLILVWAAVMLTRWAGALAQRRWVRPPLAVACVVTAVLAFETGPVFALWPYDSFVVSNFCPVETAMGRRIRSLAEAPVVLEANVLTHPIVFEVVARRDGDSSPLPRCLQMDGAELLRRPPAGRFWFVGRHESLAALRQAGWRCGRPRPRGTDSPIGVFLVIPPSPAGNPVPQA